MMDENASARPDFTKWRVMELTLTVKQWRPSLIEWLWIAWGFDIFICNVPLFKSLVAANVIVWLILAGAVK